MKVEDAFFGFSDVMCDVECVTSVPMPLPSALNLPLWLAENGHLLQPPVNNFCLYRGKDYVVMVVGGPNERSDYHINETEVREGV